MSQSTGIFLWDRCSRKAAAGAMVPEAGKAERFPEEVPEVGMCTALSLSHCVPAGFTTEALVTLFFSALTSSKALFPTHELNITFAHFSF